MMRNQYGTHHQLYDKDNQVTASSHMRGFEKLGNGLCNEITLEGYLEDGHNLKHGGSALEMSP